MIYYKSFVIESLVVRVEVLVCTVLKFVSLISVHLIVKVEFFARNLFEDLLPGNNDKHNRKSQKDKRRQFGAISYLSIKNNLPDILPDQAEVEKSETVKG